ncbi:hypothetical protein ABKN59_008763 [Abortiporus biennis]
MESEYRKYRGSSYEHLYTLTSFIYGEHLNPFAAKELRIEVFLRSFLFYKNSDLFRANGGGHKCLSMNAPSNSCVAGISRISSSIPQELHLVTFKLASSNLTTLIQQPPQFLCVPSLNRTKTKSAIARFVWFLLNIPISIASFNQRCNSL